MYSRFCLETILITTDFSKEKDIGQPSALGFPTTFAKLTPTDSDSQQLYL
jgi:hypothetical protein